MFNDDPDYEIHPVEEMMRRSKRALNDVMKNLYVGEKPMGVDALHSAFVDLCSALDMDMEYDIDDLNDVFLEKEMSDYRKAKIIELRTEKRTLRDIIDRRKHV